MAKPIERIVKVSTGEAEIIAKVGPEYGISSRIVTKGEDGIQRVLLGNSRMFTILPGESLITIRYPHADKIGEDRKTLWSRVGQEFRNRESGS